MTSLAIGEDETTRRVPGDVAAKTANFHVESLLKHLNSKPPEIRVANLR
jgi:hypothetical protein